MKKPKTNLLTVILVVGLAAFVYGRYKASGQRHLHGAHLATGLTALSQLRPHIEIFWHKTGELPCRATDLDLQTEILVVRTPALRDIALTGCGELTATYTEATGIEGGTLSFRAREAGVSSGRGLVWECVTADYSEIESHFPTCRYEA